MNEYATQQTPYIIGKDVLALGLLSIDSTHHGGQKEFWWQLNRAKKNQSVATDKKGYKGLIERKS